MSVAQVNTRLFEAPLSRRLCRGLLVQDGKIRDQQCRKKEWAEVASSLFFHQHVVQNV